MPNNSSKSPLPGQERFVAPVDETPLLEVDQVDIADAPASQWQEVWKRLRRNPLFLVSMVLLAGVLLVVLVPGLFTNSDPRYCATGRSLDGATAGSPFGFNRQGCDVWARSLYGARASVAVGVLTTILVAVVGSIVGAVAGYGPRWLDSVLSRITDVFFAIPLVLAAIVALSAVNNIWPERGFWGGVLVVVIALSAFGWPQVMRIMRGSVFEIKNLEFVDAARAIGGSPAKNLMRHIVPNALAPVIVTSTVALGIFIVAEATLSFLGLGLPPTVISWGNDIADAQSQVRSGTRLGVLFVPAGFLAVTVLTFILLGDAVRDALDPKARQR